MSSREAARQDVAVLPEGGRADGDAPWRFGAHADDGAAVALGSADIVMLPVGGYYTMDANMAKQVADVLHARVILPMHYKTEANASWPIAPVTDFLRLYPEKAEELPLLRVSAGDLSCQPHLVVLMPLSLGNVKA